MEEAALTRGAIPAPEPTNPGPLDAVALWEAFEHAQPYTVGIEDEVMLLDPETLELASVAQELLLRMGGDERFKLELPASHLEILAPVSIDVSVVGAGLLEARRAAAAYADGLVKLASAGVHPFSSGVGKLNRLDRYRHTFEEYGSVASRQLVCALQVHVAVGGAERALAVYNAARDYLPLLAALAANAPLYEGRDTGLASVRPKLSGLLPRQGVPPAIDSWESLADAFRWGAAAGAFPEPRTWWWELRPHPRYGTLEFRVPDGQSTVDDAIAVAAVAQALVVSLAERHDAGERLGAAATWRIEENRWSACRHGVAGTMADLRTGAPSATSELLHELIELVQPHAARLGGAPALQRARELVDHNGAIAQRRIFADSGPREVASWLAERFSKATHG
jgi:glutamate---cysteine ligase / carboxylate-amine ligase